MKLEIDVPDSAFSALHQAPKELAACLRLMAAAKLYEIGNLSQERAAELVGLCRQEFLVSLSRLGVSPFQGVEDDIATLCLLPWRSFSTQGAIAVLDDLAARRCACALRLKIVGTLGLLLLAKKAGLFPSIRSPLDAIVEAGLFISPKHLADVLCQAGE